MLGLLPGGAELLNQVHLYIWSCTAELELVSLTTTEICVSIFETGVADDTRREGISISLRDVGVQHTEKRDQVVSDRGCERCLLSSKGHLGLLVESVEVQSH